MTACCMEVRILQMRKSAKEREHRDLSAGRLTVVPQEQGYPRRCEKQHILTIRNKIEYFNWIVIVKSIVY